MTNSNIQKLPFLETVKRSFLYTICNSKLFLKISSVALILIVVEALTGFSMLCTLSDGDCPQNPINMISSFLLMILSVGAIVNYCRAIILKSDIDFYSWKFVGRVAKYILLSIVFGLMVMVPLILYAFIYGVGLQVYGWEESAVSNLSVGILTLLWVIWLSPLFLVYAAITVDDKTINIKEAFRLAKGNYNKIFWGQALLMLPCAIAIFILGWLYQTVGAESYIAKFAFLFILIALSFLDSCFKASFIAHIYQYFVYFRNKKQNKKTI